MVDAWWKFNHSLEMLLAMLQLIFLSIHRLSCYFVSLKKVGSVLDCLGRDLWELLSCKVNICDLNVFLICLLDAFCEISSNETFLCKTSFNKKIQCYLKLFLTLSHL